MRFRSTVSSSGATTLRTIRSLPDTAASTSLRRSRHRFGRPRAGTVSFAGSVAGNRSITVDHGDDLLTSYSFLETLEVKKGDEVDLGTVVGTVGRGHSGGDAPTHVHLSARRDGVYFDPLSLYVGSRYDDLIALTR